MNNSITDTDTLSGTLGGTMLVLLYSINPAELLSTVIVAAAGALVSFAVSVLCKSIWQKTGKKK
jgi:mannitol-specific phosphotransferase system IIBC component